MSTESTLKILLIDDDPEAGLSLRTQLVHQPQFHLETSPSGSAGLAKARSYLPDVILLDIALPDMSGFEICQLLRKNFETSLIPIIMLTASSDYTSLKRGVSAGIDDYITKPYQIEALVTRIHMVLLMKQYAKSFEGSNYKVNQRMPAS
jgi:putative two-component system response regulator